MTDQSQSDQYHWWREALAGRVGEIYEDQPQPGYYWMRDGRGGPRLPVAIWRDSDGQMICRVASTVRAAAEIWTWVAKNPVSEAHARQAFADGTWPGDIPQGSREIAPAQAQVQGSHAQATQVQASAEPVEAVQTSVAPISAAPPIAALATASVDKLPPSPDTIAQAAGPREAAIGDNSGKPTLIEEIEDAAAQVRAWLKTAKIADQVAADTAGNWRERMLSLARKADKQRTEEKRPHDEASKAVQAKWKPPIELAETAAVELRKAVEPFLKAEQERLRKESEARAQAENERRMAEFRKAEEARLAALAEAEAKAKLAAEAAAAEAKPVEVPVVEVPPEPVMPTFVAPEPVRAMAGGQRGRRTGLRTETVYEVTDYAALLAHVQDHPDVRAAVEKVGKAQARAGAVVPGITSRKDQVAA